MYNLTQYIAWVRVPRADGRVDKVPIDPTTGRYRDAHDASIWMSRDEAFGHIGGNRGAGFVFTANDPYWFIDIDDCAVGTQWAPIVTELMTRLPGAAVEVSQSGRGIHIIGSGVLPADHKIKYREFDLYTELRFVALNPDGFFSGDPTIDQTTAITEITRQYLPASTSPRVALPEWTDRAIGTWTGPEDDGELIARALAEKPSRTNIFGNSVSFKQLWEGDTAAFASRWPDDSGHREYDYSAADAALAQRLAFWTGCNCERIRDLMWASALIRDKWSDRDGYIERTIIQAVGKQGTVVYDRPKPVAGKPNVYLGIEQQKEFFKGCVYVQEIHRIYVPNGSLLRPDQFRVIYGGYMFAMDSIGEKITANAWEAFTESRGVQFPKVIGLRFRPLEPAGILDDYWVNTFVPKFGAKIAGDIGPFERHLRLLLPSDKDRDIFVSYMAACVQYAGRKFQWAPCVQGLQGNGKTIFYKALEYALGEDYCHQLDPKDIDNRFTMWIERKLLVCIEEVRTAGKYEMADCLKPMITNRRVPIQGKGGDQRTGDNCANFILFSNHKDAVLKSARDRRYCVFYTAQQEVEDLVSDGMDDVYFDRLFAWLDGPGCAAVAHWLSEYKISVNVFGRAPDTTSTSEAVRQSLGVAEQLIMEAVDLEERGFRGGLVDTQSVMSLLAHYGKHVGPRSIANILSRLGYVRHPATVDSDGRITIDGHKFRIYVKRSSILYNIKTRDLLSEAYKNLQKVI